MLGEKKPTDFSLPKHYIMSLKLLIFGNNGTADEVENWLIEELYNNWTIIIRFDFACHSFHAV